MRLLFTVVVWLLALNLSSGANDCNPYEISKGNIVCVCNSSYCDTVDPPIKVARGNYVMYSSTKSGSRFFQTTGSFNTTSVKNEPAFSSLLKSNDDYTFKIDESKKYQKIFGFGGAFTDSAGINILSLPNEAQEHLLRSYFSSQGLEYNFGRVPIGGSDFSTYPYSLDDNDNDTNLSKFSLTKEDINLKIPFMKKAKELSKNKIFFLGSAWSAPKWMKTNNAFTGFGFLKEDCYQLWADYQVKFLEAYKNEGFDIWGITTGNEPINAFVPLIKFNKMGWYPSTQSKWIAENLGPTIEASAFNSTKIILLDDQRFLLPYWAKKVMANPTAAKYIDGVATHWYWDNYISHERIIETHNLFPDKFIISSEASIGDKPWEKKVIPGSWSRGEMYINDIIQCLNSWMSAWIDWNLALDMEGGPNWVNNFVDSAILVNKDKGEFYKQPTFYAIGHFSKYIKTGAFRIYIDRQSYKKINTLAVINEDSSIVVVLHNQNSNKVQVLLKDSQRGTAKVTLEPNSFNTVIYW